MCESIIEDIVSGALLLDVVERWLWDHEFEVPSLSAVTRPQLALAVQQYVRARTEHVCEAAACQPNVSQSPVTPAPSVIRPPRPARTSPSPRTACLGDYITITPANKRGSSRNTTLEETPSSGNQRRRRRDQTVHSTPQHSSVHDTPLAGRTSNVFDTPITGRGTNVQETSVTGRSSNVHETPVTGRSSNVHDTPVTGRSSNVHDTPAWDRNVQDTPVLDKNVHETPVRDNVQVNNGFKTPVRDKHVRDSPAWGIVNVFETPARDVEHVLTTPICDHRHRNTSAQNVDSERTNRTSGEFNSKSKDINSGKSSKKRITPINVKSLGNVSPMNRSQQENPLWTNLSTSEATSPTTFNISSDGQRLTPVNDTHTSACNNNSKIKPKSDLIVNTPSESIQTAFNDTPVKVSNMTDGQLSVSDSDRCIDRSCSSVSTPQDASTLSAGFSEVTFDDICSPVDSMCDNVVTPVTPANDSVWSRRLQPRALADHFTKHEQPLAVCLPAEAAAAARLCSVYCTLLDHNLLSVPPEIQFLGSLVSSADERCCQFACSALSWQRRMLRLVLSDKALVALQHHHKVSQLAPSLSCWCAAELSRRCLRSSAAAAGPAAGGAGARYCAETDSQHSFGDATSFHAYRKQRDALYDIVRWWQTGNGCSSTLKSRARGMLYGGGGAGGGTRQRGAGADNSARLARLMVALMGEHVCGDTDQQSKLTKLRRRLTAAPNETLYPAGETVFRELVSCLDVYTWRVHVSDALGQQLAALLAANTGDQTEHASVCVLIRWVSSLSRLLSLIHRSPYTAADNAVATRTSNGQHTEHVTRSYSQPLVCVLSLLHLSAASGKLSLGVTMCLHYLNGCDQTRGVCDVSHHSATCHSCDTLLKTLAELYVRLPSQEMPDGTKLYITWVLGTLFADRPLHSYLPPQLAPPAGAPPYCDTATATSTTSYALPHVVPPHSIDGAAVFEYSAIVECVPQHRQILGPLSSPSAGRAVARHVVPVRVADTLESRNNDLQVPHYQSRLEHQLLQSAGTSSVRALELSVHRAVSSAQRNIIQHMSLSRQCARQQLSERVAEWRREGNMPPPSAVESEYRGVLASAVSLALAQCADCAATHATNALMALLDGEPNARALASVAARKARLHLQQWATHHHHTVEAMCSDVAQQVRDVIATANDTAPVSGDTAPATSDTAPAGDGDTISIAELLIQLKECIMSLLEHSPCDVPSALSRCSAATSRGTHREHARTLLVATIELALAIVIGAPSSLTPPLLSQLSTLWSCLSPLPSSPSTSTRSPSPPPRNESPSKECRAPTPTSSGDEQEVNRDKVAGDSAPGRRIGGASDVAAVPAAPAPSSAPFSRVLCARNVALLHHHGTKESWRAFSVLLSSLVPSRISPSTLCAISLALYQRPIAPSLSAAVARVCQAASEVLMNCGSREYLALSFMGDFCRDLGDQPC